MSVEQLPSESLTAELKFLLSPATLSHQQVDNVPYISICGTMLEKYPYQLFVVLWFHKSS